MLQKILWYVLLFLARIPHFIQCQETGSLVKWSGSRYETDDEIQKLPNHISCLSVKGTKKLLFQQLQKCFCENGKIFHVFNETWYGCFRPTLTCSDSLDTDCGDLGRGNIIVRNNRHFIRFTSISNEELDRLLSLSHTCKVNEPYRATFSLWEKDGWKIFRRNVSMSFTENKQFVELQVHSNVMSSTNGLLKILIWCPNEPSNSKEYMVTLAQRFEYLIGTSNRQQPNLQPSTSESKTSTTTPIQREITRTLVGNTNIPPSSSTGLPTKTAPTETSVSATTIQQSQQKSTNSSKRQNSSNDDDDELKTFIIIPAAIGGFLFSLTVIVCCVLRRKMRKSQEITEATKHNKEDEFSSSEYADPSLFLSQHTLRRDDDPGYINASTADERYASINLKDKPDNEYHQLTIDNSGTTAEPIYFNPEIEYYTPGAVMSNSNADNGDDDYASSEPYYHETIKEEYIVVDDTKTDDQVVNEPVVYTSPIEKTKENTNRSKFYVDIEKPNISAKLQVDNTDEKSSED